MNENTRMDARQYAGMTEIALSLPRQAGVHASYLSVLCALRGDISESFRTRSDNRRGRGGRRGEDKNINDNTDGCPAVRGMTETFRHSRARRESTP